MDYIYNEQLLNITSVLRIYDYSYKVKIHNIIYYVNNQNNIQNNIQWKYCNLPFRQIFFIKHILNNIYFYYTKNIICFNDMYKIPDTYTISGIYIVKFEYYNNKYIKIKFFHYKKLIYINLLHINNIDTINVQLLPYKINITKTQLNKFIFSIQSSSFLKELRE